MKLLAMAMMAMALGGGAQTEALSLKLSGPAHVRAGQALELSLHQTVSRNLTMDAVEDNDLSTEICIQPLGGGQTRVLTGTDRWRHLYPGQRPSYRTPLHVRAGESWTSVLDLSEYAAPLPPGRYRIIVRHRYGDANAAVAVSNAAEVSVSGDR